MLVASVEVDTPVVPRENQTRAVGVDLGIKRLPTLSDGTTVEGSDAGCQVPFPRRACAGRGVALHKLSTGLVRKNGCIVIKDLKRQEHGAASQALVGDHRHDFREFRRQLAYKAEFSLAKVVVADRRFPSSRLCIRCGTLKE